jgi:hypothetical protein
MVSYMCKKCQEYVGDESMDPKSLSIEIWNHFYETHSEDLDATQVFIGYLSTES